jgi:hypothetical protein
MKMIFKKQSANSEPQEDFHLGTFITMVVLVLSFIGASLYILISSYAEIN